MHPTFVPLDDAADSLEAHLSRHSRENHAVYIAVLLFVGAVLALLPFIRVGISVQATGVVRPLIDKHEVVAGMSGLVHWVGVTENARVESGAAMVTLSRGSQADRRALVEEQLRASAASLHDLRTLTAAPRGEGAPELVTAPYIAEETLYRRELAEHAVRREEAGRALTRGRELVERGLLSRSEGDAQAFLVDRLAAEAAMITARYEREWQARLEAAESDRRGLLEQLSGLEVEGELQAIRAPVSGTVEEMRQISPGSFVQAGEVIAVISPTAPLLAEVFVPASDIGLIELGASVRVLVDAYNYRDWGILEGRVATLSDDYVAIDGAPAFRAVVELQNTWLELKDGTQREVKKGMTVRARFMVAERTLWQLLRDDINDWLNPIHRPG